MKGLLAYIYEAKAGGNCSNQGISSRVNKVILSGRGIDEIFESSVDTPAVIVLERAGYMYAIPVEGRDPKAAGWMFGGTFIYSSDSRFPSEYPIPLHDRQEW